MSRRAWVYFIAVGVIWGLPYFFIRIAVRDLEPATLIFLRTALASLILVPIRHPTPTLAEPARPPAGRSSPTPPARWRSRGCLLGDRRTEGDEFIRRAGDRHRPADRSADWRGCLATNVSVVAVSAGLFLGLVGVAVLVGVDVRGDSVVSIVELFGCTVGYATAPIIVSRRLVDVPTFEVVTASVAPHGPRLPALRRHAPARRTCTRRGGLVGRRARRRLHAIAFMFFFALIKEAGPTRARCRHLPQPGDRLAARRDAPSTSRSPLGIAIGFPMILVGSILGTWRDRGRGPAPVCRALRVARRVRGTVATGSLKRRESRARSAGASAITSTESTRARGGPRPAPGDRRRDGVRIPSKTASTPPVGEVAHPTVEPESDAPRAAQLARKKTFCTRPETRTRTRSRSARGSSTDSVVE